MEIYMKKVLLLLAVLFASNAFAEGEIMSNQECINLYRSGYLTLQNDVERFNDGYYNRFEFSFEVTATSSALGALRGLCLVVESPTNEDCVTAYKDLYKDLRGKVKLGAILSGNQTAVTYSMKMQKVVEEETREVKKDTLWANLKRSLKIGAAVVSETIQRSKDITMLEFIDQKCGN